MAQELIRRIDARPAGRLIVIGDIHGCYEELRELLTRVAPGANDLVMSVGDIVTKGPAADRCLDLWRDRGYLAVRGNNELKTLARARPLLRLFAREEVMHRADLLLYIRSWPLVIDFPSENVTIVHGGFLPHMNVIQEDIERERDVIPELRWIRKQNGEWRPIAKEKKKKDDVLWSEKWRGDRFVLYGHTPLREPRRDRMALGLDTGCVYGGALTAAIYDDGDWKTMSVKAKRKYAA
ncbi:MAG TPA: metallophosphoesterase [Thermoanaerobaculia bacterium]|jgi:predicted phosphodiesterase|nr:metallophosphoesterase [Thermoanaerobaculia bacterium]